MNIFEIDIHEGNDAHHCTSHQCEGWIIWKCPICDGNNGRPYYERRMNWETGEMQSTNTGKFRHVGFHNPNRNNITVPLIKNIEKN